MSTVDIIEAAPPTAPATAISSNGQRMLRILFAARHPLRTRALARLCRPGDFAAVNPTDYGALRRLCGRYVHAMLALEKAGLLYRQTVEHDDGHSTHPWQLTAAGLSRALELAPWSLDPGEVRAAESMRLCDDRP